MHLENIMVTSGQYWNIDNYRALLVQLGRIMSAQGGATGTLSWKESVHIADDGHFRPNPDDLALGSYASFLTPLATIIGPNLRRISMGPLIYMHFPVDFLDIFRAAPRLQRILMGNVVGTLVPPSTNITLDCVLKLVNALRYLVELFIPWMVDDDQDMDDMVGIPRCGSPPAPSTRHTHLLHLGFPCFSLDMTRAEAILAKIATEIPSLKSLSIFSTYVDPWEDSMVTIPFAIRTVDVYYR